MTMVEILYFEGCPGFRAAVEAVEAVVAAAKLDDVTIRTILIEDARSAGRQRFLGSPSVRVDGRDVDPEAEGRVDFGLQCRVYSFEGRLQNAPPTEWIERALGLSGR